MNHIPLAFSPLDEADGKPWRRYMLAVFPVAAAVSRLVWRVSGAKGSSSFQRSKTWRRLWYWNRRIGRLPRLSSSNKIRTVGSGLKIDADLSRLTDCFAYVFGVGEFEIGPFFERVSGKRPVVLDIGANVGTTSLAFAAARPDGVVFAFEPGSAIRGVLTRNLQINDLHNVTVVPVALGDEVATFALVQAMAGNPGSSFLSQPSQSAGASADVVSTQRLDDWAGSRSDVSFIKMDVEGFEVKVIRGGAETIRRCRPIIVAEVHAAALERQGSSRQELLQTLSGLGYTCCALEAGRPVAYRAEHFGSGEIHNVVAFPTDPR